MSSMLSLPLHSVLCCCCSLGAAVTALNTGTLFMKLSVRNFKKASQSFNVLLMPKLILTAPDEIVTKMVVTYYLLALTCVLAIDDIECTVRAHSTDGIVPLDVS